MIIPLSIIGGTALIGAGYTISVYNTIKTATNDYEGMIADISAEYQRRADLYLNLAKTCKGHMKFEKTTLVELTKARSGLQTGKTKINQTTIKKMDSMFGNFRMQMEAYPELQSNKHYSKIMDEISNTEDRIITARGELNNIAEDYNTYIQLFPTNMFANLFKAKKLTYFKTTERAKKEIEIDL